MRPFVYRLARAVGVGGRVRNDDAGVTIEAFGDGASLRRFLALLEARPPAAARLDELRCERIAPEAAGDFAIVESQPAGALSPRVSIPADLATCPDCLRELFDPGDRRFRYPFINCTNCGPRLTIIEDIPYDRSKTTMRDFDMCPDCQAEYDDPSDRRFHAQPIACPECGPQVWLELPVYA